jgi:hypothetical protein
MSMSTPAHTSRRDRRSTRRLRAIVAPLSTVAACAGGSGGGEEAHAAITAELRHSVVGFLRQLVSAQRDVRPGEPCPGETAVQELVSRRLGELGCAIRSLRYDPATLVLRDEFADISAVTAGERVSVIGSLSGRGGGGRSLILFAHPDGEPIGAGAAESWSHTLFDAELSDDGRV